MNKSESIKLISKAILSVMDEVEGIEKNLEVGSGNNKYAGVADKDVKKTIGASMRKNGLSIVPISYEPQMEVNNFVNDFGKNQQTVVTALNAKYLLMHSSGEFVEVAGYGQGVDSQDKSAGKASTYALKNLLLYMFLVPTGRIDDADNTHSDDIETADKRPWMSDIQYKATVERINSQTKEVAKTTLKNAKNAMKMKKTFVDELDKIVAAKQ